MTFVFAFDHKHRVRPMDLKDLLGGKGANLAEMTSVLALPVPPGFTISTDACRAYMARRLARRARRRDRPRTSRARDGMGRPRRPADPLLVSVRSGAKFSMPGMMDTVLNLGLNDASVEGLARRTRRAVRLDSYRRFLSMYGRIVLDVPGEAFDAPLEQAKAEDGVTTDAELRPTRCGNWSRATRPSSRRTGEPFPQDPMAQLRRHRGGVPLAGTSPRAVAYRERERIPDDLGTAVNVQAMVFGNRDDRSGTGVGFTRNPSTGASGAYGDFLVNAQGEDVVAGIRATLPLAAMADAFPMAYTELLIILRAARGATTATCSTPSSPSSRAGSGCCRPASASGPATAAMRIAVDPDRRPQDPA